MYHANLTYCVRPKLAKWENKLVTRSLVFLIIQGPQGPEPPTVIDLSFETKIGLG